MTTQKKPMPFRYGIELTSHDNFKIPVGTTAQRTASPLIGLYRYNTTDQRPESYTNVGWLRHRMELTYNAVVVANFAATLTRAYPCNTTAGSFTATLPTGAKAGDRIAFYDANGTWDTNGFTIASAGSDKIQRLTSVSYSVKNDYVVLVFSGIVALGWVRESGGIQLSPVYDAINAKADKTYVDTLQRYDSYTSTSASANASATMTTMSASITSARVMIQHIVTATKAIELIELSIVKDGSNNVHYTVASEVRSVNDSTVTLEVDYSSGIRIKARSSLAGTFRIKSLWEATV